MDSFIWDRRVAGEVRICFQDSHTVFQDLFFVLDGVYHPWTPSSRTEGCGVGMVEAVSRILITVFQDLC